MPKYTVHDGELVSLPWKTALVHMERRSGPNNVNEGKRTIARQTYFWNCYQCQCCNNGNLAARPSPVAPHIRVGRLDHAIDFADGARAEQDLKALGINAWRTVPGEAWHVEVDADNLKAFHEEHAADKWDALPAHIELAVRGFIAARHNVRSMIRDRDKIDSKAQPEEWMKRDRKVADAVRKRGKKRARVERMLERTRKESTKRLLGEALGAPDD
jgi:hypothetical protein